jgi:predicted Zn-dependent peptidase
VTALAGAILLISMATVTTSTGGSAGATTDRLPAVVRSSGPAGSLLMVEPNHAIPLVHVVVAARGGYATDPHKHDGLTNLAAQLARRGAGKRARAQIDAALDELGATLEVDTDPDSVRFVGHVLARNLDPFLAILADIVVRPQLDPGEMARTVREIAAQIDESRNDDQALCARFFVRNLYGDHPYGRPAEGTRASLEALTASEVAAHFQRLFVGRNLVFAATGDVEPADLEARLGRAFAGLREGVAEKPAPLRTPVPVRGWRIQLVDKPDRQQAQIMFGHAGPPATDPDFVALQVGLSAFGGHGMTSTLMDEVRTKRGLAYGAYLSLAERRGAGAVAGWVFSSNDKVVATLKLVLKLYLSFMEKGLDATRVAASRTFVAGSYASEMDVPEHRLDARLSAEMAGLPPDFVDTFPERVRAVTPRQVNAAISKHVRARDLAISMVATAATMKKLLLAAKIKESSIDVVGFESQ